MSAQMDTSMVRVGARVLNFEERSLVSAPQWPQTDLPRGYPGVVYAIYGPGLNHVVVQWVDLEDHPESFAYGYDHDLSGRYNLLVPDDEGEWSAAQNLVTTTKFAQLGWKRTNSAPQALQSSDHAVNEVVATRNLTEKQQDP